MENKSLRLKAVFFSIVIFGSLVAAYYAGIHKKIIQPVLAEDDDEEEDKEDGNFEVIDTAPSKKDTKKNETKTIKTKLSDTVTQTTTTIIRHDSDGDGKYDDEDPHPTINEYFIVKDDDLNGIDDQYEQ